MKICEELQFVEIFEMIREFCLKWVGSCQHRSKGGFPVMAETTRKLAASTR